MKKFIALFLAAAMIIMVAVPAMAVGQYPLAVHVAWDGQIIEKAYRLEYDDDPAGAAVPGSPMPPPQMMAETAPAHEPAANASPEFSTIGERLFLVLLVAALFGLGFLMSKRNKKSKEKD